MTYNFQFSDLLLLLVYLTFFFGWVLQQSTHYSKEVRTHFLLGFVAKVVGLFTFLAFYIFYYQGGDTFIYYKGASQIYSTIMENPVNGFSLLTQENGEHVLATAGITMQMPYFHSQPEWILTKIAALANLLCFDNFLCLSLLFAYFSFLGSWAIYRVFVQLFPLKKWAFFVGILLIPSCLFWASGLLKDSLCLGLVGFLFQAAYGLSNGKKWGHQIFLLLGGFWILFLVKFYLGFVFLTCLCLWLFLKINESTKNSTVRMIMGFSTFLLLFLVVLNIFSVFPTLQSQFVFKESVHRLKGYHSGSEGFLEIDNSNYHLGEIEYTPEGLLRKAPAAVITALFRPYVWEQPKWPLLLMGLENLILALLLFWMLLKSGKFWENPLRYLFNNELIFCLAFVVMLAFVVGLTSFNFGLLMRLKTPYMPFLGAGIAVFYSLSTQEKKIAGSGKLA